MDYINPFSGMGGDQTIESPFLRDMDRQKKFQMAEPFVNMARQNQQVDMQKKLMEMGEFSSPQAQQLRAQKIQTDLIGQQQKARALPWATDFEIAEAKGKIESQPYMTTEVIEKAKAAAVKAQGSPAEALYQEIGTANSEIKKLPQEARQLYAQKFIEQWQARHPGAQLPSAMRQYDPQVWDQAELVAVYNADFKRKTAEQKQKDDAHMARDQLASGDRRYVADKAAESRIEVSKHRGTGSDNPKTDVQFRDKYTRVLRDPEATPQELAVAQDRLKQYADSDANKLIDRLQLDILKEKRKIDDIRADFRDRYVTQPMKDRGVSPQGSDETINVNGVQYKIIGKQSDGSLVGVDPKTGQKKAFKPQ